MEFLKDETPIAKKEHCCSFCGAKINVGEQYRRVTVADEGINVSKYHLHCFAAISEYNDGFEVDIEQVMESVDEELNFNGITPKYHVCDVMLQWAELQKNKQQP